jgi:hypothetical protein
MSRRKKHTNRGMSGKGKKAPRSSRGSGLPGLPRGDVASAYYNSARQFLVGLPAATYAGAISVRWGSNTSQAQQIFDLKWISRVRRHHTHTHTHTQQKHLTHTANTNAHRRHAGTPSLALPTPADRPTGRVLYLFRVLCSPSYPIFLPEGYSRLRGTISTSQAINARRATGVNARTTRSANSERLAREVPFPLAT